MLIGNTFRGRRLPSDDPISAHLAAPETTRLAFPRLGSRGAFRDRRAIPSPHLPVVDQGRRARDQPFPAKRPVRSRFARCSTKRRLIIRKYHGFGCHLPQSPKRELPLAPTAATVRLPTPWRAQPPHLWA